MKVLKENFVQSVQRVMCLSYILLISVSNISFAEPPVVINIQSGDYPALESALHNMEIDKVLQVNVFADGNGMILPFPAMQELSIPVGGRVRLRPDDSISDQYIVFEGNNTSRLAQLGNTNELWCNHCEFRNFGTPSLDGGVINITDNAYFGGSNIRFIGNQGRNGGALYANGGGEIHLKDTYVLDNSASNNGGFASIGTNSWLKVYNIKAMGNTAGVFGGVVDVSGGMVEIKGGSVDVGTKIGYELPFGNIKMSYVDNYGTGDLADATDDFELKATILFKAAFKNSTTGIKANCNDFGTGAFKSLGYNISNDNSCGLNMSTDFANTDPMMSAPDSEGIRTPLTGSPAIDGGSSTLTADHKAPCLYKDINGLGRPQDANGDGVFECDIGAVEIQNGSNLGNSQTGVFYDVDRSGEGVFVEMLSATSAWVVVFSYDKNGVDLLWMVGIGQVVGNTIVVDEMSVVNGGNFGAAFNPANIESSPIGSLSLVFPDCEAASNPGKMVFSADDDSGYEDLFSKANRLTRVLNCDNSQPTPQAGRTGSYYEPTRSGEGILVHWLPDGTVLVTWFTYTPDGKPFWLISSSSVVTGNSVTLDMLYPETTTGFGSQFVSEDLVFSPWGSITLSFNPGCASVDFSYNSTVSGYGSGNYVYQRLTTPAGVSCDL